jgi:hypothetical protein
MKLVKGPAATSLGQAKEKTDYYEGDGGATD